MLQQLKSNTTLGVRTGSSSGRKGSKGVGGKFLCKNGAFKALHQARSIVCFLSECDAFSRRGIL
jgi:hypothetical protein